MSTPDASRSTARTRDVAVDLSAISFLDEVEAIWGRRWGDVIEVEMSEFVKTGGGPHCATAGLIRDSGPFVGSTLMGG